MYNAPTAPADFIRAVRHSKEQDSVRLIVRTAARGTNAVLLVGDKSFAAYTNKEEPYDFSTHGFLVPADLLHDGCPLQLYLRGVSYSARKLPPAFDAYLADLTFRAADAVTEATLFEERNRSLSAVCEKDTEIAKGLCFRHLSCKTKNDLPVECYLLIADSAKIGFEAGVAEDGKPTLANGKLQFPIGTVEEAANAARHAGLDVVAATNGDFFDIFGDNHPAGLVVRGGEVLANPESERPFFGVLKDGTPVITSLNKNPNCRGNLQMAVCGSHVILENGEPADLALIEPFGSEAHPRTAVGICPDGKVIVAIVDGRIPDYSNGATLADLALLFRALGADTAINLDGGGSSILLVRPEGTESFQIKSRPADLNHPTEFFIRRGYSSLLLYKK